MTEWWIIQQNFSVKWLHGRNVEVETRYVHGPYTKQRVALAEYDKYVDMYGKEDITLTVKVASNA